MPLHIPLPLLLLPPIYLTALLLILLSPRLQRLLIYLPFIRPPAAPSPALTHISNHTRTIRIEHLSGWHVLPPGPPFSATAASFAAALARPAQRVILFFHGTLGTRAFPPSRVRLVALLAAHFRAHVVAVDYTGFAGASGRPSERALRRDALLAHAWITQRMHPASALFVYGMSLGSFPALALAAEADNVAGVVTDSAMACLLDAVMTHPLAAPVRLLPWSRPLLSYFLADALDNVANLPVRVPWLLLHALQDGQVPYQHARKLYDAALDNDCDVELVGFHSVGHNNVATADGYLNALHAFITRCESVL